MHTAWGRTLKDVFQRYNTAASTSATRTASIARASGSRWASSGNSASTQSARSRNTGSPSLRVSVGRRSPGRRRSSSGVEASRPVDGLGQRLLHLRHEHLLHLAFSETRARAWVALPWTPLHRVVPTLRHLYLGARAGRKLRGAHRSFALRPLPLLDRPGQSLTVWTTTPWTLPANVAAAVHPEEEYGLQEDGEWVAVKRYPTRSTSSAGRDRNSSAGATRDCSITCPGSGCRAPRHRLG